MAFGTRDESGVWSTDAFLVDRFSFGKSREGCIKKISKVVGLLRAAKEFRFAEQMQSAAGSIMDGIAEGFERNSRLEFANSLSISKGECGELKSQLY